jgi:putative membrane protein
MRLWNDVPIREEVAGMSAAITAVIADMWDSDGHMGGGWWIVMMFGMVFFWAAIILGIVLVARGSLGGARREQPARTLEILERRFAEGAISADEYRERRDVLVGGGPQR